LDCKSALPVFLVMAVSVGVSDGRADERSSLTLQALLSSWTSKSEPPVVQLTIVNHGPSEVWLTRRFVLNDPESPPAYREIWFDVREVGGAGLPFSCTVRASTAPAESYVRLETGHTVGAIMSLGFCYKFSHGHRYEIVAHWKDSGPMSRKPPKGALSPSEELVALPILVDF
jgi:hypothetical protein